MVNAMDSPGFSSERSGLTGMQAAFFEGDDAVRIVRMVRQEILVDFIPAPDHHRCPAILLALAPSTSAYASRIKPLAAEMEWTPPSLRRIGHD